MNIAGAFLELGKRILLHGLFWLVVLLFFTFFFGFEGAGFNTIITFSAFFLPVTMGTTYAFVYRLIPDYLILKKYLQFVLYSLAVFIISATYISISAFYGIILTAGYDYQENFPLTKSLIYILISVYLVVAIASAFSLLKYNYSAFAKNEELKNRILEAQLKLKEQELQYLKTQIHPHFLFNTLNTIYGLSLANKPSTPEMILRLSELLDYILYQTKKPLVKLEDEVNHIRNYIDLERKRFQDTLEIELNCDRIPLETEIAPMLLLPFVENSFKHGKGNDGKLQISIWIKLKEENLDFKIVNSIRKSSERTVGQGIGLQNIKRRLDLIYGDDYQLNIENRKETFCVYLQLNTSKFKADV
ncbi:histidine kinase [Gramella sp. GC03-9]|uniref:Histidine kinase n=1 Tax=Christiangramia oceanisediminis TaxID=2920386 RepID=A0A9X2KZ02_9FLAO|nr:histidine kinase [Gramella oceanisediminis]MCP9200975.1 histidine kinase [Gramella oceanisediminis]